MRILILGGTRFVGRHLVEAALARGHNLTLFNRGQQNPELFPHIEKLHGDRDGDLSVLKGRQWDAVIDTCGYVPRVVRLSADLLANSIQHYTFISSISVYADPLPLHSDETALQGQLADETSEDVGNNYGPLKVLCERVVEQTLPERALIIRPGIIVGPHDPTDRFTYWLRRAAQSGEVLVPGPSDRLVQFIDGRDLAEWIVRLVEAHQLGIYHATGPRESLSMQRLLDECNLVSGGAAHFTWIDEQFLLNADVQPWSTEMPLWAPASQATVYTANCGKALAVGLRYRALADTIRDTLQWAATRTIDIERRAGLSPDKEHQLLQAWHAQLHNHR